jgi:Tyrosine phosphatase family
MAFAVKSPLAYSTIIDNTNENCVCSDLVIDMQGTKKVDIPEEIMHLIMKIALDDSNYPILIHCNHGKVLIFHLIGP